MARSGALKAYLELRKNSILAPATVGCEFGALKNLGRPMAPLCARLAAEVLVLANTIFDTPNTAGI